MNASQLKKWKDDQYHKEKELVKTAIDNGASNVKDIYRDLNISLSGSYTTSLDPYIPLWSLIPFFDQIIVGILPYHKTEEDFFNWYGVTVKQLHLLEEQGRVKIRIIFPRSASTIPKYLNGFFTKSYPTTLRDYEYNSQMLGESYSNELRQRFQKVIKNFTGNRSIDSFEGNQKRALSTAQTVYLQLASLGNISQLYQFENLAKRNFDNAFKWLEVCRLFYVGPEHYSLGGIHSVAKNAVSTSIPNKSDVVFPDEVGKILVETFKLYKPTYEVKGFTFNDCIAVYQDAELARNTLLNLASYIKDNSIDINTVEDLRNLISRTKKRDEFWMRTLRIAAATSVAAATIPFEATLGVLAGLGFSVISELPSKPIDRFFKPIIDKNSESRIDPRLTLLLKLDEDIRKNYKNNL